MPIYEYLCPHCNRIYSFYYATMTDAGAPTCPRCGATDLEREVSLFAFVRGGTDPLAAIPKVQSAEGTADEDVAASHESGRGSDAGVDSGADAGDDAEANSGAAAEAGHGDTPPVRDPGLYRQEWDGTYVRLRDREMD